MDHVVYVDAKSKELEKLLEFKEETEYIIIKPRQFLGLDAIIGV